MLTEAQALAILERYTPELGAGRDGLLAEHTSTRTVAGQPVTLYDPYAAAVAHIMHPATVKARSEGGISETYLEPDKVAAYLTGQSELLRAAWPAADAVARPLDLTLTFGGW